MPAFVVGAVEIALAAVVFLTRPDRRANRCFAAWQFAIGLWSISYGLTLLTTDSGAYFALYTVGAVAVSISQAFQLLFLGTLATPLAAPLRWRPGRWIVLAAGAGLAASAVVWPLAWHGGLRPLSDGHWAILGGPLWLVADAAGLVIGALALVIAVSAYRRARTGLARRQLGAYAVGVVGSDGIIVTMLGVVVAGLLTGDNLFGPWFVVGLLVATLWLAAWVGYGILTAQLFDIDIKVKWTISRGTPAAVFLAVFFIVATVASEFITGALGYAVGGVVAGLLLFFLAPLQRMAERVSDKAMPGVRDTDEYRTVRKREVYRAAVESALQDGRITDRERDVLATLQHELGLPAPEAVRIEREAAGAAKRVS